MRCEKCFVEDVEQICPMLQDFAKIAVHLWDTEGRDSALGAAGFFAAGFFLTESMAVKIIITAVLVLHILYFVFGIKNYDN